jgi:hypothetical protein
MASKLYQVTLDENGDAITALELPQEPAKNRVILVREDTANKAKRRAESLFSLAK